MSENDGPFWLSYPMRKASPSNGLSARALQSIINFIASISEQTLPDFVGTHTIVCTILADNLSVSFDPNGTNVISRSFDGVAIAVPFPAVATAISVPLLNGLFNQFRFGGGKLRSL